MELVFVCFTDMSRSQSAGGRQAGEVLAPTRELAEQIYAVLQEVRPSKKRHYLLLGRVPSGPQDETNHTMNKTKETEEGEEE